MDDSKFFKLQYKHQSTNICAIHFIWNNLYKLVEYLNKLGLEAQVTCPPKDAISIHIYNCSLGKIDKIAWLNDYIIFIVDDKNNIEEIEIKNSLSHIFEEYYIVMKDGAYDQDEDT